MIIRSIEVHILKDNKTGRNYLSQDDLELWLRRAMSEPENQTDINVVGVLTTLTEAITQAGRNI